MATLTGNSIASTYTQLLKLTSATLGADASAKYIEDGAGTDSALSISTTRVGIGSTSPDTLLHLKSSTGAKPVIKIEQSGNNVNGGGITFLTSSTATNDDLSGTIRFKGMNDASEETEFATIYVKHTDIADGSEDGQMKFRVRTGASFDTNFLLDGNSRISLSNNAGGAGNTVFGSLAGDDLESGGTYNTFFGANAGHENQLGDSNIAIGSGTMDASYIDDTQDALTVKNVFIGNNAGGGAWTGSASHSNVGIGHDAMDAAMDGAIYNTAVGYNGLTAVTSGDYNSAIGADALAGNTTGTHNTAVGYGSLYNNATTGYNTAVGVDSGSLTTGADNTYVGFSAGKGASGAEANNVGVGSNALLAIVDGQYNVAIGSSAGLSITTGDYNVCIGYLAGDGFDTEGQNVFIGQSAGGGAINGADACVAIGYSALSGAATQDGTIAIGKDSLAALTSGGTNTAVGYQALTANTIGHENTALGYKALLTNVDGDSNTAIGMEALKIYEPADGVGGNTAVGYQAGDALTTGNGNTLIGRRTDASAVGGVNQIVIGNEATGVGDNSVTLGNASVTDVYMSQDSQAYVHSQNVPNHVANTMSAPYYRFDGVDDVITVTTPDLPTGNESRSMTLWVKTTDGTSVLMLAGYGNDASTEMFCIGTSSGTVKFYSYGDDLIGNTAINDGLWHHIVVTHNASDNVTNLYVDGTFDATDTGVLTTAASKDFLIGKYPDNAIFAEMETAGVQVWNKALTATEVKELYSGASVPFKYKGANQTELIAATNDRTFAGASNWANASFNSYDESGDLSVTANGTNQYAQLPAVNAPMTAGKTYRLTYDASTIVGTFNIHDVSSFQVLVSDFAPSSSNSHEFTVTDSRVIGGLRLRSASSDASGNFDNFSLVQIGAVAEYDGSGAGEKIWGDKSGNDLHGTVSGATLENTPYDSGTEYEEGTWTGVISDASARNMTMDGSYTTGYYTKIGNLVTISGYFASTALESCSGSIRLTGLPFTQLNSASAYSGGTAAYCNNLAITAGHSVTFSGVINSTYLNLNVWDATTGTSGMQHSEWSADGSMILNFSYQVA